MKLYHGTNAEILRIDLKESRVGKDFGIGFYLTPDKQVAQRQAERKFEQYGVGEARVYEYTIGMFYKFVLKKTPTGYNC